MNNNFNSDFAMASKGDKMLDYQFCESSCESLGTGPTLKTNLTALLAARSRLKSPSMGKGKVGDSKSSPSHSCSLIKTMYPLAKHGF